MRRASRGRFERPLSLRDVADREASIEVVVGCDRGASVLGAVGGGTCEVCCDVVTSTSGIVADNRSARGREGINQGFAREAEGDVRDTPCSP